MVRSAVAVCPSLSTLCLKATGVGCPGAAAVLEAHCLAHIARYKRPKDWRFVAALPKNHYGKVLKTELRERLKAE